MAKNIQILPNYVLAKYNAFILLQKFYQFYVGEIQQVRSNAKGLGFRMNIIVQLLE